MTIPFTGATTARQRLLVVFLWGIFAAGLSVQAFAPRLQIANNAFVIPSSTVFDGPVLSPVELVEKQRRLQWLSGLLTVGGALGLAIYYLRRPRAL